jgi:protease secretion system outer membrane protein
MTMLHGKSVGWVLIGLFMFSFVLQVPAAVASDLPEQGLSIFDAYKAALENDPATRIAQEDLKIGEQYEVIGRSSLLPQVVYNNTRNRNYNVSTLQTTIGSQVEDLNFLSKVDALTLRQPLFSVEALARFRQGRYQSEAAQWLFAARMQDLIARLAEAYANLVLARRQLRVIDSQLIVLHEERALSERLLQGGEGTITDLLEVQSRLDMVSVQRIEALDAIELSKRALLQIVGDGLRDRVDRIAAENPTSHALAAFVSSERAHFEEPAYERWAELALSGNPELRAARALIESSRQELLKAIGQHAPRVDGTMSYGHSSSESVLLLNRSYLNRSIGISLSMPIYAGGATQAAVEQARASLARTEADFEAKKSKLLLDLKRSHVTMQSGLKKLEALRIAEASSRRLLQSTEQSVKGGVRIRLHVLQAQSQLAQTQIEQVKTTLQVGMAYIRSRSVTGQVDETDLTRFDKWVANL